MTDEETHVITRDFIDYLYEKSIEFMRENIPDEELETRQVLNIVLSSHISTIYNLMLMVDDCKEVKRFIKDMTAFLGNNFAVKGYTDLNANKLQ
jgi:hypothetical protein